MTENNMLITTSFILVKNFVSQRDGCTSYRGPENASAHKTHRDFSLKNIKRRKYFKFNNLLEGKRIVI
jgi:hypothetical protein